ncbi:MAG: reactive intermediate/imine deaminase [Chloroflexi bacterium]|nr:MAG: reactive intermediate/imine deaminase [Chloroflexota bacterium]
MPSPEKQTIIAPEAPKPIGPYSVGVQVGNLVFTAGQAGLDPSTGKLVEGGIEVETRRTLTNIRIVLKSVGLDMSSVVKTTVYLRDMAEFSKMNAIYAEFFPENPPARTTIQAAALPFNAAVEIEAVAFLG